MVGRSRELALVLGLIAAAGCGGRTSILASDYETGFGGDEGVGGSAIVSGSGGSGQPFGGGSSGTGGATGAGGTTGGSGGGGGTILTGDGGSGGNPPAGSSGAKSGQGGVDTGGSSGTPAAGAGGSPDLQTACEDACKQQPAACLGSQSSDCDFSCAQLSNQFAGCQQEITDYFNCLSDNLDPGAACMLAEDGNCYGAGCTHEATNDCSGALQIFSNCEAGCSGSESHDIGCSFESKCPDHDYSSHCELNGDGISVYDCSCTIDGTLVEVFTLSDQTHDICADADTTCTSIER